MDLVNDIESEYMTPIAAVQSIYWTLHCAVTECVRLESVFCSDCKDQEKCTVCARQKIQDLAEEIGQVKEKAFLIQHSLEDLC